MAVWQWDLWLVPRVKVFEYFPNIPEYVDLEWFESIDWWVDVSQAELRAFFNEVLPYQPEQATPISERWGLPDETCIRLMIEEEKITDVSVRIDARNIETNFLRSLIDFAKTNGYIFFTLESNRFVEPEKKCFSDELNRSRAMRFVKNPLKFFEDKPYLDKINKEIRRKWK